MLDSFLLEASTDFAKREFARRPEMQFFDVEGSDGEIKFSITFERTARGPRIILPIKTWKNPQKISEKIPPRSAGTP